MILNSEDTFLSLGNQGGPVEIEDVGEDLDADFGMNFFLKTRPILLK